MHRHKRREVDTVIVAGMFPMAHGDRALRFIYVVPTQTQDFAPAQRRGEREARDVTERQARSHLVARGEQRGELVVADPPVTLP
jgi:hypothetical protein